MSARAALSGSLDEVPLTDLLPLILQSSRHGVIELSGAASGIIVIDGGGVTVALADDGPNLQQVIIGSGVVSAEAYEAAHLTSLRGTSLSAALLDAGADADRLEAAVLEQTIATIFGFLVPSGTDFAFVPGATHPLGSRFPFDATYLLDEAGRRLDAWRVIAEVIPSVDLVMRIRHELPTDDVTIAAADWRVLARVDGRTTIAELSRDLGMSGFTVCGVLHQLVQLGVVERAEI